MEKKGEPRGGVMGRERWREERGDGEGRGKERKRGVEEVEKRLDEGEGGWRKRGERRGGVMGRERRGRREGRERGRRGVGK